MKPELQICGSLFARNLEIISRMPQEPSGANCDCNEASPTRHNDSLAVREETCRAECSERISLPPTNTGPVAGSND